MCALICANPKTIKWLDVPLAVAHRQALQLRALFPQNPDESERVEVDEASTLRVMNRSAWIQAYCRYRSTDVEPRSLSEGWQKALDAIAHAWGRILSLIGLRW
jgi:hypothetical protein